MDCLSDRQLRKLKSGELNAEARAPFEQHVAGCESCRARLEALRGTTGAGSARAAEAHTSKGMATVLSSPTVQVDAELYAEATATGFGPFESSEPKSYPWTLPPQQREVADDETRLKLRAAKSSSNEQLETKLDRTPPPEPEPTEQQGQPLGKWEGVTVGSYRFLEPLWKGENCELFRAQETLSHREVAMRVVELSGDWRNSKAGRLLADARVLSDVKHPGISRVHEIRVQDGKAFIAMDLEEGLTLEDWLATAPRSQRERVKVFVGAANAMAVLHGAGLVHGDFTPQSVRIAPDGSVRLSSLSLTRPLQDEKHSPSDSGLERSLRYAAPDRLQSEPDARAEQFSFCAVFYEALTGALPYASDVTRLETRRIPRWLRPLFRRGLNRNRESRYESMRVLAAELRKSRRQSQRLKPVFALAAAALLVFIGFKGVKLFRREPNLTSVTSCAGAEERVAKAWNDKRKEEVRAGVRSTKRAFTEKTASGVLDTLQTYTQTWETSFRAVCAAPTQRGAAAIRLCLEQRMLDLEALVDVLSRAEPRVAIRALDAARTLPDPTECAGGPMAVRKLPQNPSQAWTQAVTEGMQHLSRARAFAETDQPWRAPSELALASDLAQLAPDAWLSAEVLVLQGTLKSRQADAPNAERVLRRALLEAQGAGHALAASRAAGQLGFVYGVLMGRAADAERAFEQAFALSSYVADDALTARLLLSRASVYENLREPGKALEDAERALSLLKGRGVGTEHAQAAALNTMGRTAVATGKADDALVYQKAALALLESSLGPNHPEVARALEALALVHVSRHEQDKALPLLERATSMRDRALGAEDPSFGSTLRVLCDLYRAQRAWSKAEECLARAVEVEDKRQSDASLIPALLELARVHEAQQKPQLALASYQRAAILSERLMGTTSQPSVASALRGMAGAYIDLREPEKARQALERSVSLTDLNGVDLEPVVRLRVQLTRALKGPAARAMGLKAREDAARCGPTCAPLVHDLDAGAARLPPGSGSARFPARR